MTEPDEGAAAGRGRMRAGHADRERVVAVLKSAFVQGRLDQDELEARVGRAYASQTYAGLAALTADIPAASTGSPGVSPPAASTGRPGAGSPAAGAARSPSRTLGIATRRAAMLMLVAVALAEGAFLLNDENVFGILFFLAIMMATASLGFFGYGIVDAVEARRSLRQAPRSGPGGRGVEGGQPGRKPTALSPRDDPSRADLRAHRAGQVRPVYGTAAAR